MKKNVLAMGLCVWMSVVAGAEVITLTPVAFNDINPEGNPSSAYAYSTYDQPDDPPNLDNYVIVAEYDVNAYDSANLVDATLTFTAHPLWGYSNYLRFSMIPSDLQITAADFGSSDINVYAYNGAIWTGQTYSYDVTAWMKTAMDYASPTQGAAYRWEAFDGARWLGGGTIYPSDLTLTLNYVPEPATMLLLVCGGILGLVRRK